MEKVAGNETNADDAGMLQGIMNAGTQVQEVLQDLQKRLSELQDEACRCHMRALLERQLLRPIQDIMMLVEEEEAGSEEKHVDFKVMDDEDAVPAPTTQKRESQRKIRARKPTAFVKRTVEDDGDGEEEEAGGGGDDLRDAMAAARAAKTAGKSKAAGGGVSFATNDQAAPKKMRARQATKFVRASADDDGDGDGEEAGSEEKHVDFKVMDDEDAVPAPTTQKRESQRKIRARKPTAFVKRTADDDKDGEEGEQEDRGDGDELRDAMAAARAAKTAENPAAAATSVKPRRGGGVRFA
jgi:hypothetical protein